MSSSDRLIGVGVILISTCSEAVGQLAFKRAANHQPSQTAAATGEPLGPFAAAWANLRWIVFGWFSFVLDGLLWSAALYYLDITVAHPIGSIVFVVVAIFSKIFLHEQVSRRRWIGIGLILFGAAVVAVN
jgi:undecaprenyl phosphate-alpha-L-ara4N flippase subunit ArnE